MIASGATHHLVQWDRRCARPSMQLHVIVGDGSLLLCHMSRHGTTSRVTCAGAAVRPKSWRREAGRTRPRPVHTTGGQEGGGGSVQDRRSAVHTHTHTNAHTHTHTNAHTHTRTHIVHEVGVIARAEQFETVSDAFCHEGRLRRQAHADRSERIQMGSTSTTETIICCCCTAIWAFM